MLYSYQILKAKMKIFELQTELSFDFNEKQEVTNISPYGFREYDARWLYPDQINKQGLEVFGYGLGQYISDVKGSGSSVVVGHDYRSYSEEVKYHVVKGLLSSGLKVMDVGLSVSPMVYFAQHHLNTDSLAMITASHNENGWTGIKCGIEKSLTFGPEEVSSIKKIVDNNHDAKIENNGIYQFIRGVKDEYIKYLSSGVKIKKGIKVVVACGNGTAGVFAPELLKLLGCEVIELHCDLDFKFPHYNPNPEDLVMLKDLSENVIKHSADIGFAFDGDGDRLGVVDDKGEEIFSDKIGLLLSEFLSDSYPGSKFVVDVKSTGLYFESSILKENNCVIDMWKTGHSHIKRRVKEIGALCGFEKSGHFFINEPLGLGFDDGLKSACLMLQYLSNGITKKLSDKKLEIKKTFQSPTMAPFCEDGEKYQVVDSIIKKITEIKEKGETVGNQNIEKITTINGIRFELTNGSWGLVRASSNKPSLVIVIESYESNDEVELIFNYINELLDQTGKVGEYDQTLTG